MEELRRMIGDGVLGVHVASGSKPPTVKMYQNPGTVSCHI